MFDSEYKTDGPRVAPRDQERGWETALRTPFRVVFFPLRLVAMGFEAAAEVVGPRYLASTAKSPPKSGPTLAPFLSLGAVNDVSLGAAVKWIGFPNADAKLNLSGSWSTFDGRRARFSEILGDERPVGFRLGADYDYKPNRRYYGTGNNTPESDLSYFLLETTTAEAALLLGSSPMRQVRLVGGYSSMTPGNGYHGDPLLDDVFSPAAAPYEDQTTQEYWYGVTADFSAVDDGRDPSLGVQGSLDLRRAVGSRSIDPDYDQWRAELRAFVPVFAKRRVLALRGVYAGVQPTGGTTILPFYRLAESRGDTRFAGYSTERFRDRQLLLARVEYRWPIIQRINAYGLFELGEVAPNTASFRLSDTHKSYGGGLRLGLTAETAFTFELAGSVEGLHALLGLGSDF